jgi:hypothetical protein
MDAIILNLREYGVTVQALAVTVGGLIGVFSTLSAFFLFIFVSALIAGKTAGKSGRREP